MEKIKLSKRLQKVAEFVKENEKMLDIGSDHAQLPIYLVEKELVPEAVAGELVQRPYEHAAEQIERHGVADKVATRLGSGFDVINKQHQIGTAVISGMGGTLIAQIIKEGIQAHKINENMRLVLQPNNNQPALRKFLMDYQFAIEKEAIIKENKRYSEIIVVNWQKDKITYTQEELLFGPVFLKEQPILFKEKWKTRLKQNKQILNDLDQKKHRQKIKELTSMNQQIEKVVK